MPPVIDFENLPLSPNGCRGARNYLGLSQAQAATKSNLPAHKLKRFETGNYVPDTQFLEDLREFFEGEGYNFHDEDAPGAKAKARGDVFPAGVVGDTMEEPTETTGFPLENQGKLPRPQKANLQFMRIAPTLENDQIDRVFDCIEENEEALQAGLGLPINTSFLGDGPSTQSQAQAIALVRRLAENGLLYANLMGRDLLPQSQAGEAGKPVMKPRPSLFGSSQMMAPMATIGELLAAAMGDLQLAVIHGDKEAQARRKGRAEPTEVLQALVG